MLGVLCARPKPWILAALSLFHAHGSTAVHNRLAGSPIRSVLVNGDDHRRFHHSTACRFSSVNARQGGAASIWHAILPARRGRKSVSSRSAVFHRHNCELTKKGGEGSWNAAWDARPARWLQNPNSAWLLFGVCPCLAAPPPFLDLPEANSEATISPEGQVGVLNSDSSAHTPSNYTVTGVPADGRCLFRAIAHLACLRNGEEAPDENRQRDLADELRANVVNELLQRREEAECFIEGDFDAYVKTIEKPYAWGGEPELRMASHVLKTPISVFMVDRISEKLINISNYGEEYAKDGENSITVLFHGYGHYDILEIKPEL
ncbi:unnamed protein product [Cuscuta epithymum]|uniref:Ubiquitin thioesterase OTU n=1 Tax=Cuscuta epithymum TaxID=186058 RepID=A0AAV0DSH4_9ASTE|nr:unnamed protein product [Cuscuta epithymum]